MKKAALYIRISGNQQNNDRQIEELTAFANKEGYTVVAEYDDTLSGYKGDDEREQLKKLLNDCKSDTFDTVLFSEFSRLGRSVDDLSKNIAHFQKFKKKIYFQKQNLWVTTDSTDLGSQLLIYILSVISSYEIELMAERSISGKLSAIRNRNLWVGAVPFGYDLSKDKTLIINKINSKIVVEIYDLYLTGNQSYIDITELVQNKYNLKVSVPTILNNPIYKGLIINTMHEPEPKNTTAVNKRINRKIKEVIERNDESIRLISNELFDKIQQIMVKKCLNKDNSTKIENLLKPLLSCGCCGSNYAVAKSYSSPKKTYQLYKCFEKVDKKNGCTSNLIQQARLNGLVISLSLNYLTSNYLSENSTNKIEQLTNDNTNLSTIIEGKQFELKKITENWKKFFHKAVEFDFLNSEIQAEKDKFESEKNRLEIEINSKVKQLTDNNILIQSLTELLNENNEKSIINRLKKGQEIKANKQLIKELLYQYIAKITVHPLHAKYSLVVIKFNDDYQIYGTIKSAKYSLNESYMGEDGNTQYKSYLYLNNDGSLIYDNHNKVFVYVGGSLNQLNVVDGLYTSEQIFEIMENESMFNYYTNYKYEDRI